MSSSLSDLGTKGIFSEYPPFQKGEELLNLDSYGNYSLMSNYGNDSIKRSFHGQALEAATFPARLPKLFSMSSNYNSRFKPAEVMIHDGKDYLIRKRDTIDDLVKNQIDVKF